MLFLNLQHTVNPVKTELLWLEIDKCLVYTIMSSVVSCFHIKLIKKGKLSFASALISFV